MLPYIVLLLISITCLFFPDKRWAKVLSLLSLFIVSAFRGEHVGTDTFGYIHGIEGSSLIYMEELGQSAEFIKITVKNLIYNWGLSGRFIIIFYSLITIGSIPFISRKLNVSPVYLCFLFLTGSFVVSLNICRQVAAGMLIGLASCFIYEEDRKKSLWFFFFIAIAFGIHSTSIIFTLLYVCRYIKVNYRTVLILALLSVVLGYFGVVNIYPYINRFMGYTGAYQNYYSDIFEASGSSISFLGYLVPLVFFCVKMFLLKSFDVRNLALYMIAACVPLFFKEGGSIVGRLMIPFSIISSFIFAISMADKEVKDNRRMISMLMIIPLSYMYLRSVAVNNEILPYYFGF